MLALVGVDFGTSGNVAPPNWNSYIPGVYLSVTLTGLIDETGNPMAINLLIQDDVATDKPGHSNFGTRSNAVTGEQREIISLFVR